MATTNKKTKKSHVYEDTAKLAGGYGPRAAKQGSEATLRRLVLSCLLWEDNAYQDGVSTVDAIKETIPLVEPAIVAQIALEARHEQKLRHVPLLLCREMLRHEKHKTEVSKCLASVILRPDEISEFISLYWKTNDGKKTLPAQAKKGIAKAFQRFDEYQLSKWNKDGKEVKLRDALFLCHAKPKNAEQEALWKKLVNDKLAVPDTWEVGLSAAKTAEEKKAVWERLIDSGKLPAFALLKNLRNMEQAAVGSKTIIKALTECKPTMLLPIDFLKAAKHAPNYLRELERLMLACTEQFPRLSGHTVLIVDVSGSMQGKLSAKSEFSRVEAALAMAILASEMCERISIYATAGSDAMRQHQTEKVKPLRGFALSDEVLRKIHTLGGGGIFTRQCLEFVRSQEREEIDRILVFSDSQDCDIDQSKRPVPFGKRNYIVDVSPHKHGINYQGSWTAEIAGWSDSFLRFIAAYESAVLN